MELKGDQNKVKVYRDCIFALTKKRLQREPTLENLKKYYQSMILARCYQCLTNEIMVCPEHVKIDNLDSIADLINEAESFLTEKDCNFAIRIFRQKLGAKLTREGGESRNKGKWA